MDGPRLVMVAGSLVGLAVLILVGRELGSRLRSGPVGQALLVIFLGLGVLSIATKTVSLFFIEKGLPSAPREFSRIPRSGPASNRVTESSLANSWLPLPGLAADRHEAEIATLGRRLFSDPILSRDGKIACSSCHDVTSGGDDGRRVSVGIAGQLGTRNAPSVLNAALLSRQFWDGRAATLEEQAHGPVLNPVEMGQPDPNAVTKALGAAASYQFLFRQAFGNESRPMLDGAAVAIAAYERKLVGESRYDRFVRGDFEALSFREQRGMALFAGLGCRECHRDPTFSSAGQVRPGGVMKPFPIFGGNPELARYRFLDDLGAAAPGSRSGLWRTPSLRNVGQTAPYFHNGSVDDLREAIRIMMRGQLGISEIRPGSIEPIVAPVWNSKTRKMSLIRPKIVSERDVEDLYLFLNSLSKEGGEKP